MLKDFYEGWLEIKYTFALDMFCCVPEPTARLNAFQPHLNQLFNRRRREIFYDVSSG